MATRAESVQRRVNELEELLDQWEDHRITARDPSEVMRANKEIDRIKSYLKQYDQELAGRGKKVEEDRENPILAPALKRNNRRWMIGILLSLFFISTAYYTYEMVTKEEPNYQAYLEYLEKGNELIKEKKFQDAQVAYEKALVYFPKDTAVAKKVNLLREANRMVKEQKYQAAEKIFKVILNVPASSQLSFNASHQTTTQTNAQPNSSQMSITMEWSGQDLLLNISGGAPFSDPNAPYGLTGLNCQDCISWKKTEGAYQARIDGSKAGDLNLTISINDRLGNQSNSKVPSRSTSPAPLFGDTPEEETVVKKEDPQAKEKQFKKLIDNGDDFFQKEKFGKAKTEYLQALGIKSNDTYTKNQIAKCEQKLAEIELKMAKAIANIPIKSGTFKMGYKDGFPEERPVHDVALRSFRISKHEVTVAQFRKYCDYKGLQMPPAPPYGWKDNYPIANVTWEEADAFCKWVGGRLPTEAEWEYAARDGGGIATYSGGNLLNKLAIYDDNSKGHPEPVGSKRANSFRIYDMTGNVSEWCADWYGKYPADLTQNPEGPSSGKQKIIRGGGYTSTPASTQDGDQLRATYRNYKRPNTREPYIGFRVAW